MRAAATTVAPPTAVRRRPARWSRSVRAPTRPRAVDKSRTGPPPRTPWTGRRTSTIAWHVHDVDGHHRSRRSDDEFPRVRPVSLTTNLRG